MTAIPTWPDAPGPRVLTLVGNDLTIDVRARKTASSLARSGFSVVSIGIDHSGTAPRSEDLDGALLVRVVPPADPRISPRVVRTSRAELRDSFGYRAELERQRLQMARRYLVAEKSIYADRPSRLFSVVGRVWAAVSRRLRVPHSTRVAVRRKLDGIAPRIERASRGRLQLSATILSQRRYQALSIVYRFLARPGTSEPQRARWRSGLPELHRYEAALGGIVDAMSPDLVHVHDIFHLGLAARAKLRAASAGRVMRVVYDAHEFVPGLPIDPRKRAAYVDLETEYAGYVDGVVTVSPGLAKRLEDERGLAAQIVMNAPDTETATEATPLRSVVGIAPSATLITYVGGIAPHRGAEALLEAMTHMPLDAHLVFVAASTTGYVAKLLERAAALGLGERVHVAPYVAPEAVVSYIRSADVSVIPLSRKIANYEVALPNKLFQSIHAGVPVAVSDNPDMAEFVLHHGVGEVFAEGDTSSMVHAITTILNDRERYEAALADPTLLQQTAWQAQAARLIDLYRSLGVSPA